MPWQSIYNFKGGTSKPKERSPAPTSDASSSGDQHVASSRTQGPGTHYTVSATEYSSTPQVHFAPDAWPTRSMQTSAVNSLPAPVAPSGRSNPLYGHPDYTLLKPLNEGTFGSVHLVLDRRTNEQVAMKFMERGPGVSKSVLREILNHRLCVVHPSIVQFKEVFLTPKYLAIVMEYAAGGDMFEYVIKNKSSLPCQGLSEDSARWFFQQLVVALEFCHELARMSMWTLAPKQSVAPLTTLLQKSCYMISTMARRLMSGPVASCCMSCSLACFPLQRGGMKGATIWCGYSKCFLV
ncbi:hypothetical protein ABBQ32_003661 [Trebouxia sp. C0010 RCD-2024]